MDVTSPQYMVYQALQCACSQNSDLLKPAEQKLAEWEVEPGFYSILIGIVQDHTVDVNVRWMAAVCFKNGIDRYWRKNAQNEIKPEEKASLKSALLTTFNEPIPQIASQIAVIVAKIARHDCPREWGELIPHLLEVIQKDDQIQQHRGLLTLQHVVKSLSSRRLAPDKKLFEELTENVYSFILRLWDGFTTLYFQSVQEQILPEISISYLEKGVLSLKILRKLTIYGFYRPQKSEQCMMFVKALFQRLKECLECRLQVKIKYPDNTAIIEQTEKFILKQMKILNEFLELHPSAFLEFIPSALEFAFNYVFNEGTNMIYEGNVISFSNFAINCINLIKGILSNNAYSNVAERKNTLTGSTNTDHTKAIACKNEFFTRERLSYICDKIIMHYFLLTKGDLDLWDEDPESFALDEGGESWKYSLRPCTETFFLTLYSQFRQIITQEIMKFIQRAQMTTLTTDSDLKDILIKDAIYNAVGLSAFHLFDEVNFDEWFQNQLLVELKIKSNNFRIIRRSVIWLIGQWTGIKFSKKLRPQAYAACLELLQPSEDMAVRLAASKALMKTMDDFEFEPAAFLEFLEPSFGLLFNLLKEVKECDTKMNILYIMSFIVEKMSDNIHTHANNLSNYLPLLWDESEDHNMLRCAIISTLLQIVKALCDIPQKLAPFLYPVIRISTDVKEPSHVYLLEEGLELWLIVIENSTTMTPELLQLCANVLPIIENSSETLRTCLYIIQSYILLNPEVYLQRYGKDVVSTCAYLLSDLRPDGIVMIMKLFEACLRAKPEYAIELLRPVLPDIAKKIYEDKEYPMVMSMYLTVIARVLLLDQIAFSQILQEMNTSQPLEKILDVWIAKMPLVTHQDKRKLLSIALSSLITVQNDTIFKRFSGILINICETLNDIMKEDEEGVTADSLILSESIDIETRAMWSMEDFEYKTYHYERCRQLSLKDPVHTIVLKDYLQSQLILLKTQLGDERYTTLILSVDKSILSNLIEFVSIGIPVPSS